MLFKATFIKINVAMESYLWVCSDVEYFLIPSYREVSIRTAFQVLGLPRVGGITGVDKREGAGRPVRPRIFVIFEASSLAACQLQSDCSRLAVLLASEVGLPAVTKDI